MAHGQPDYGMYARKRTVGSMADNAELAARLGSIDTYDRRGDTIFLDDFESGINKWSIGAVGTGASVLWSAEDARSGAFSAKITAGSDQSHYSRIYKSFQKPILSNLSIEFSFSIVSYPESLFLFFWLYDGIKASRGTIGYEAVAHLLKYYDSDGNYQNLETSYSLPTGIHLFNTMKLVVDWENLKYKRLRVNHEEWDMSSYPLYSAGSIASPYLWLSLYYYGLAGQNGVAYFDDVIIKQNEP